jgi:hypothetical protein
MGAEGNRSTAVNLHTSGTDNTRWSTLPDPAAPGRHRLGRRKSAPTTLVEYRNERLNRTRMADSLITRI